MTRFDRLRLTTFLTLSLAAGFPGPGRGQTWEGPGTDWNTAANWSPATVPNGDVIANFAGAALGTVNISSSVSVHQLAFSNPTGNYNLTSSAGMVLSFVDDTPPNPTMILVAPAVTGTNTINFSNVATGNLVSDVLFLTNNSTAAGTSLVIGPNTVIGKALIIVSGSGNSQISGSSSSSSPCIGISVRGPGSLTFSGNGAGVGGNLSTGGGLSISGGKLVLDYSTNTAAKVGGANGMLTLGGGVLSLTANAGTPVTQTIPGGTSVLGGHTDVGATGTGTITLNTGAITRTFFGTVDFGVGGSGGLTFNVTTSAATSNGLLGTGPAFATVNGGQSWATVSGGAIAFFNNYGTNTFTPNTNVDVTASSTQANITANSLRINASNVVLTLSGTNTIQSGGILVPGGVGGTITGGTLTVPGGGELLVHGYNTFFGFTINSSLVSTFGLTKTGPGTLTLGGNNTGLTGQINVSRGNLTVTNTAAVNSASQISFNDDRSGSALQKFTVDLGNNTNGTINPPITASAFSPSGDGTVFSTGNSLNSRITLKLGSPALPNTPIQLTGDASGTSGFNISFAPDFTSAVTLAHGFLGLQTGPPCPLILNTADAHAGGVEFIGTNAVFSAVTFNSTTRIISNGVENDFVGGIVTSAGSGSGFQFVKAGTGTLTYDGFGNGQLGGLTLSGGTLLLDYSTNPASKLGGGA